MFCKKLTLGTSTPVFPVPPPPPAHPTHTNETKKGGGVGGGSGADKLGQGNGGKVQLQCRLKWVAVEGVCCTPEVARPVVAMGESVVLQAEQAHVVGQVQLHPRCRVCTFIGGEPVVCSCLPHHPLDYVPGPPL